MTIEETIKTLEMAKAEVEWNYPLDYVIAIDKAIEILKKKIPYKPKEYGDKYYTCKCGNILMTKWLKYPIALNVRGLPCCLACGQEIDWGEENGQNRLRNMAP